MPIVDGGGGDGVGHGAGFAVADGAAAGVGPGEEGHDGARGADFIAVVEVVGAGVVEIDGCFYEALAEDLLVEVEVALGVAGHGGDMV